MKGRAFICYGQGGRAVGTVLAGGDGPKAIAARLTKLGFETTTHAWDEGAKIASMVKALPAATPVIIGGTSLGANEAPMTALLCGRRPIDLIFGIQPSSYGRKNLIPANVAQALCFYNPTWWMTMGFGSYQWTRAGGNRTTSLSTYKSNATHPGDTYAWIHDIITAHAKALVA